MAARTVIPVLVVAVVVAVVEKFLFGKTMELETVVVEAARAVKEAKAVMADRAEEPLSGST